MTDEQEGFSLPSEHKRGSRSGMRRGTGGRASDVPGVEKDRYGRYLLAPPSDPAGEVEPWTSVTTIVGQASGNEGLRIWTERGIVDGLAESNGLRAQLASTALMPPEQAKKERDRIREEAKTLSGLHDAREWGSACHREWEMWAKLGQDYPGPPPELAADVTAGITAVLEAGLQVVKVEQVVAIEHLRVAGRLDTLYRSPSGKLRVGDWKTGKDVLTDPSKRENFACQFSGYANCTHLWNTTARFDMHWQVADELEIDREVAYLIHVHDGTARIYEVPIADAWRDFQARAITHRHSSKDGAPQFLAIGRPVQFAATIEDLAPMPVTKPSDWSEDVSQHVTRVPDEWDAMTQLGMVLVGGSGVDGDYSEVYVGPGDEITEVPVAPVPAEPDSQPDPAGGTDEGTRDLAKGIAPHEYKDGYSGMVCDAMVMRDGGGDACGLPSHHPIHEPEPDPDTPMNGVGEPLQPLAKDVGAKRGCGKCGRIGHRSGSPACLGDADPNLTAQHAADGTEVPFPPPASDTPPDATFCDGLCQANGPYGLEPERDEQGAVTGRYVCAGCGKPATVAAVRAHVAAVGSFGNRSLPEQHAAHERVVQPATIPDPPAITWGARIKALTDPEAVGGLVADMRAAGEATPELLAAAKERWLQLQG